MIPLNFGVSIEIIREKSEKRVFLKNDLINEKRRLYDN